MSLQQMTVLEQAIQLISMTRSLSAEHPQAL